MPGTSPGMGLLKAKSRAKGLALQQKRLGVSDAEPREGVRQTANVLDQFARQMPRQRSIGPRIQRIGQSAKALGDRTQDLVVAADRREQVHDIIGHLLRHLGPPSLSVIAWSLWPRSSNPCTAKTGQ